MKLRSWCAAALAVCAVLASESGLHAKQAAPAATAESTASSMASEMDAMEQSELATYNSYSSCSTGSASCSSGGGMSGLLDRPIQLVFGAEYIYAKANFSDALAYVEQDLIAGGETWHCYDFDYNSSYGFYGGVYLPDCGGSMLFNFRRLTSDAQVAATSTSTVDIFGPFEIDDNIEGLR